MKTLLLTIYLLIIAPLTSAEDLAMLMEQSVNSHPQVQLLQGRIRALDEQLSEHSLPVYGDNPVVNRFKYWWYRLSPAYGLSREKERLVDELSALEFGLQENYQHRE